MSKYYKTMFVRELSDTELVDKYKFMEREIERQQQKRRREKRGLGLSRDMVRNTYLAVKMTEYKYQLLKEINKRGLTYE